MLLFRERKKSERKDNTKKEKRGEKKGWRLAWAVGEDELAPLGSAWSLFLFEGGHNLLLLIVDLGRFSKMTKHFCHLPQLLCDRGFFPFRGQCLGCGGGGQLDQGSLLPDVASVMWRVIPLHTERVSVRVVSPSYLCQECRASLKGRNAQRPSSVSLGCREADLVTGGEAPGLVRTW